MRFVTFPRLWGACAAGLVCAAASPAWAAAPLAATDWRAALSGSVHGAGCFKANYPDTAWTRIACIRAPQVPYVPLDGRRADTVGDGNDYAAGAPGLISAAAGSFHSITGLTSEKGFLGQKNTYSLQLNANFFTTTVCNGASVPASCLGWQQFVYSNSGTAFMQYWLIDWNNPCPSGWTAFSNDCYRNSEAVGVPKQPLSQLANLAVSGQAVANGTDTMIFTTATSAYTVTGADSVVRLAEGWSASEYNVIGDGDGSEAKFNTGTSIVVQIGLTDGTTAAPSCQTDAGTTGETNNLNLGKCKVFSGATPTLGFVESN